MFAELLILGGGLVFEQMCIDLEDIAYAVQPFIIPAASVNAPHKRERVWIIARVDSFNSDTDTKGFSQYVRSELESVPITVETRPRSQYGRAYTTVGWRRAWHEIATELCGVDDGLPAALDGLKLSKSRHRTERLKALGNSIVPQVAMEIFKVIKRIDERGGDK